jgi:hypothetical protein
LKNSISKFEIERRAKFATDVIKICDAEISGKLDDQELSANKKVRAVAFGLIALRQATTHFLEILKNHPDDSRLPKSGLVDAAAIVDALTTGKGHPVWKHIEALQTPKYRSGAAYPVETDTMRRRMVAGLVCAYKQAANVKINKAAQAVADDIKSEDFSFSAGQLRKWVDQDDGKKFADQFLSDAKALGGPPAALPRCVLIVGRKAIWRFWSTPKPGS